ncbi:hypothetical protein CAPTEDRAFT_210794 [Capitella teleta]|uniref:Uncharacterized protein n=1 Tax=Capitella teleta TaxID=283909 RepID=R7U9N2_CAPTE|nr:hypothetical protein CAPTEDRAFT_210794 [Capitella teleta]|eukprot:ELT99810.1 hypothetical protein CAPTEDRAFT_210794 [Capitella teleta]
MLQGRGPSNVHWQQYARATRAGNPRATSHRLCLCLYADYLLGDESCAQSRANTCRQSLHKNHQNQALKTAVIYVEYWNNEDDDYEPVSDDDFDSDLELLPPDGKNVTTHMPGVRWARQDRQTALYRVDLLSKLRRILMTDCHRQGRRKAIRWVTRKGWSSPG